MTNSEIRFYRQAVREGNLAAMDLFFKDFSSKDKDEQAQLVIASITEASSTKVLDHLLTVGIPLDYVEEEKQNTLLHLAACSDYPEIPAYFIKKGLDVHAKNTLGATPFLFGSCYTSNPKVLQVLIEAGSNVQEKDNDGASALCIASRYNDNEAIINFLVHQGLDVEERDNTGLTPFLSAIRYNSSLDVCLALRDAGAEVYAKSPNGDNALHLAALNQECSQLMIESLRGRFRTTDKNDDGYTPLSLALVLSDNPVVINALIKSQQDELLYAACQNKNPQIVSVLQNRGLDLNARTGEGLYPVLWVAKYNENPEVLEEFIKAGAIMDVRDLDGRTVLHYAAINENTAIYDWLKEQNDYDYLDVEDDSEHKPEYYRTHLDEF